MSVDPTSIGTSNEDDKMNISVKECIIWRCSEDINTKWCKQRTVSSKYEFNPQRNGYVSNGKMKENGDRNVSIPQEVKFLFATTGQEQFRTDAISIEIIECHVNGAANNVLSNKLNNKQQTEMSIQSDAFSIS